MHANDHPEMWSTSATFIMTMSLLMIINFIYTHLLLYPPGTSNAEGDRGSQIPGVLSTDTKRSKASVRRSHQSRPAATESHQKEEDVYFAVSRPPTPCRLLPSSHPHPPYPP